MNNNYICYHLHTELSLLDSCTNFKLYIDKAKELGQPAICFTEHGNCFNWIEKKEYCEQNGIKYMHGVEIYLTSKLEPKIRDNYHTVLIAKNYDGVKEINKLISISYQDDHFYYKPRITFEEFRNISDNVIKISACLASPLNRLRDESMIKLYDYLEVQPHINSDEQKEYNKYLYSMSIKYNKPLIAGTDTHSLDKYKAECRNILQIAKWDNVFSDSDLNNNGEKEFDLTYKTYNELCDMFQNQGVLPESVYKLAINNTNIMAESVEEFTLDKSFKYAKCYEDDELELKRRVNEAYKNKIKNGIIKPDQKYIENCREELRVFKKIGMLGFMLFMSDLVRWCWDNNIPVGFCRGSCGGSTIAYLIDIIDVDPVKWNTVFSRFANEDRRELGDIDIDISPTQREMVYDHIIQTYGVNYTAYILAIGTISDKATIDEIGRALAKIWAQNNVGADIDNPYSLDSIASIKEEYDKDAEKTKDKYKELFYYFDGLLNTAVSQSMHPAGIIVSPITLYDNYGLIQSKGKHILQINMEECHEVSLNKYDLLGLKNVEIIKDTCILAGIPYPKSHQLNWDDREVWKDMISCPTGIFQFEGRYAFDMLKKFVPTKINHMSLVNAALRPSGASYRDRLMNHEVNHNPSSIIDDLLKSNNGFLVFQEDTIAFLQQICGLSGSEADNIRRAIGRKQKDRLEAALPKILEGYCNKSDKPREQAEKEAMEFLQIIEDSANYQFGYNHSTGYSMIGYTCAYLRYYYPLEFISAYLNNANNEEDIKNGTVLASVKNIKIVDPKFGHSKDIYMPDKKENKIYKGIKSIKYMNDEIGNKLYEMGTSGKYKSFIDILKNFPGDSRQLDILIRLGFFSDFGNQGKLLAIVSTYNDFNGRKVLNKNQCCLPKDIIVKYAIETERQYRIFDADGLMNELYKNVSEEQFTLVDLCAAESEFVGYITYKDPSLYSKAYVVDVDTKYSPKIIIYCLDTGLTKTVKMYKKMYTENPVQSGDIITYGIESKQKSRIDPNTKQWVKIPNEYENWFKWISIRNKFDFKINGGK